MTGPGTISFTIVTSLDGPTVPEMGAPTSDPSTVVARMTGFDATLRSVTRQRHARWEWRIVGDPSAVEGIDPAARSTIADDRRIVLEAATAPDGGADRGVGVNAAIAAATGDFVVFVDVGDRLDPRALDHVATALADDPRIDVAYTDEAIDDPDSVTPRFFLKPDWSPARLRAQNYCSQLLVFRRSLIVDIGGVRPGFGGAAGYDLILRATERARRIHHVPEVLYRRASPPDDRAAVGADETDPRRAGERRAVQDHLDRVGLDAVAESQAAPGLLRVRFRRPDPPPKVSIVIPSAGTARPIWGLDRPLVLGAVTSLLDVTEYPAFEVIVVIDPNTPTAVVDALGSMEVVVVAGEGPFNFSARCNQGVAASDGDLVLLLNDDMLIEQPDWLDVMVGAAEDPGVGAVGARLLFADGTLQHAGVLFNQDAGHVFRGFSADLPGPFGLLHVDREVSMVTGACLLTPRRVYDELGGLSEKFAVAFNDLDYCLRVRRTGRRVVWTPHATLYHFESQSRSTQVDQGEIDLLYATWGLELGHDPYGNPNLAEYQFVWRPAPRLAWKETARRLLTRTT